MSSRIKCVNYIAHNVLDSFFRNPIIENKKVYVLEKFWHRKRNSEYIYKAIVKIQVVNNRYVQSVIELRPVT